MKQIILNYKSLKELENIINKIELLDLDSEILIYGNNEIMNELNDSFMLHGGKFIFLLSKIYGYTLINKIEGPQN